jgi:hypothetical protein
LITITAREKEVICKQLPNVHIVRTMRQHSGRHRYYMTEDVRAMRLLNSLRKQGTVHEKRKDV